MSSKLAVLIIPGSFSYASHYYDIVNRIKEQGYDAYVSNLMSATREPPEPPATMYDDADHFRRIIILLADQGKDIIVLMHSYGGGVGSQAVKGVLKTDREALGLAGGVVRLVYLTATAPPTEDIALAEAEMPAAKTPEGFLDISDGYMMIKAVETVAQATFSDWDHDKAVELVKRMAHHSAESFASPLTYPGYRDVPCSYILCEDDCLIPLPRQQASIDRIKRVSGQDVDVHRLSSGHAPTITAPGRLIEIITKILAEINHHRELDNKPNR